MIDTGGSIAKITPEARVKVVFFMLVTGAAESLQVTDVILTTTGKGNNVINGEFCL